MKKRRFLLIITSVITVVVAGFFTLQMVQADPLNKKLNQADAAFKKEDYEKSKKLYEEALEIEPGHVESRLGLANSLVALREYDKAIDTLNEGIRLNHKEPRYYYYLSTVYFSKNNMNKVIETLEKGIDTTQNHALEELFDQFVSNIEIEIDRRFIQIDHSRELSLIWKNDETSIPIKADWYVESTMGDITEKNDTTVEFTAYELGNITITAKVDSIERELKLQVEEQVLEEIHIQPTDVEPLSVGQQLNLSVSGLDANGNQMDFIPEWSTSKDIVELNNDIGQHISLTALEEGLTKVTVEYQELEEEVDIIVAGKNKILKTEVEGYGSIYISPDKASYEMNSEVELEAVPTEGSIFVRWEGDVRGTNPQITVVMDSHKEILAVFEIANIDDTSPIVIPELEDSISNNEENSSNNYGRNNVETNINNQSDLGVTKEPEPDTSSRNNTTKPNHDNEGKKVKEEPQPPNEEKEKPKPQPKITTKIETDSEVIGYGKQRIEDPTLPRGKVFIEQEGKNGTKIITYEVTYTNGKLTNRVQIDSEVTQPVDEIIRVGTKDSKPDEDSGNQGEPE